MAIEVTQFNYPGAYRQNINEVYDWLVANASDYFPGGIVKDTNLYAINCYPLENDTVTRIAIPFYNNAASSNGVVRPKYATNDCYVNPNGGYYNDNAYMTAAKTDYGFAIRSYHGSSWFVSRTENGDVCTVAYGINASNGSNWRMVFSDLANDRAVAEGPFEVNASGSALVPSMIWKQKWLATSFTPLPFFCGTHSPNIFVTFFTQSGTVSNLQRVIFDGVEYVYDGFVALKG